MKKLFFTFLLTFLVGAGFAQITGTLTITRQSIVDGGGTLKSNDYQNGAEITWAQKGIQLGAKYIASNPNNTPAGSSAGSHIQVQANSTNHGVIYNTVALPGRIVSITLTQGGTPRNCSLYCDENNRIVDNVTTNTTCTGTQVGSNSTTGWTSTDFTSTNYTFFAIKTATANATYFSSIIIEYEITNPVVFITYPLATSVIYPTTIALAFNFGNITTPTFEYSYNGGPLSTTSATNSPINIGPLSAGNYALELIAYDGGIPVASDSVYFSVIMPPPPSITITSPTNGDLLGTANVFLKYDTINTTNHSVFYKIDNGTEIPSTVNPEQLTGLLLGQHTVVTLLYDAVHALADTDTVNFTVINPTTYELVTNTSGIMHGEKYLIVGSNVANGVHAMGWQKYSVGANPSPTNRLGVPVTVVANEISTLPATTVTSTNDLVNPYEFTILINGNDTLIFDNINAKYLRNNTTGSGGLVIDATPHKWNMGVTNDTLYAYGTAGSTYNWMKYNYNIGSPMFNCYTVSSTGVYKPQLYKAKTNTANLLVYSPLNNTNSTTATIPYSADIFNLGGGQVKISVNGTPQSTTTNLNGNITLDNGTNVITFELVDAGGNSLSVPIIVTRTVNYNAPTPTILITTTQTNYLTTDNITIAWDTINIANPANYDYKYSINDGTESVTTANPQTIGQQTVGTYKITFLLYEKGLSDTVSKAILTINVTTTPPIPTQKLYKLVTSQSELVDAANYLIVGEKNTDAYALSLQKTSNRHAALVTLNNNVISVTAATVATDSLPFEIQLEAFGSNFALKNIINGNYLYGGPTSNALKENATPNEWALTIGTNNFVTAIDQNSGATHNTMRFNPNGSSTPLFNCYQPTASTGTLVYFYKEHTDPILSITSPANNTSVSSNFNVDYAVYNFTLGTNGKVIYYVDNQPVSSSTIANPINVSIAGLSYGTHTLYVELVDMSDNPFNPAIKDSLKFKIQTTNPTIEITTTQINYLTTDNITIAWDTLNIANPANYDYKYSINDGAEQATTKNPQVIGQLGQGTYTITFLLHEKGLSDTVSKAILTINVTSSSTPSTQKLYKLVTSQNDFVDAANYLIVGNKNTDSYALSLQKSSNRHAEIVTLDGNLISVTPATTVNDSLPFEIQLEAMGSNFALKNVINNKYLFGGPTANALKENATQNEWELSIASSNLVTALCVQDPSATHNVLRFNPNGNSTPLFNCYQPTASTGTLVYFYKEYTDPMLLITSPANNAEINTNFNVNYTVYNFVLGTNGKVRYYVDTQSPSTPTTANPINVYIAGLSHGTHTLYLELVDMSGNPLNPVVKASLTFIIPSPTITITYPTNTTILSEEYVDVEVEITNFTLGTNGKIKYTLDSDISEIATATEFTIDDLDMKEEHTLVCELVDMSGKSFVPPITSTTVTFNRTSAINNSMYDGLSIYPNPATNLITIKSNEDLLMNSIEIYDISSKLITTQTLTQQDATINISTLTAGVYFVKIGTKVAKLIVE